MKQLFLLLICFILIVSCATTDEKKEEKSWKWTKQNTILEAINFSANVVDYLQTRRIAQNPERWYEKNALLGRHPTVGQVNMFFPLLYTAKLLITIATPNPYRYYVQGLWIGISGETIRENYNKGIKP